ncbi:MAG: hypothetical protein AABZ53_09020 [Planctomycetota bacterium]
MSMKRKMKAMLALCAAGFAGVAHAQTVGPDVIVGDLPEVSNLGASGGFHAYAVGTTSCNLGNQRLTWISNNNQHPVISQNAYRLNNGRFEQIGQAWLKHGFCALQGTVCGSCSPNPSGCPALGVGCSDPYSSGLNGSQGGLGPKSEVNVSTGYFPYPFVLQGTGDATLKKRLVIRDTDLDLPGSLYFTSSMYVQPEDAGSHNNNNNQSYRRITFDANRQMSIVDSTQRTKPAIFAWRDHGLGVNQPDPDVQLTAVDITGDGRFWVGSKAINLGGGQWRYEYSIENLTSDRSASGFSVPFPAGSVVTNAYFHDVDYAFGEPYVLTDWTNTLSSTSIEWNSQTHAQNVNANALRWDTIYTYSFVCNVPPAAGQATLTLFKPGPAPSTASVTTVTPSADGQFHPFNDFCANAPSIGEGTLAFSNVNATTDGPTESGCVISGDTQLGSDIWYRYNPGCAGAVTITTCGSAFDTKIAVYNGCPVGPDSAIICNDDSAACGAGSLQSSMTFNATAGASYMVRVGGFNGATGTGTMSITNAGCLPPTPPSNDECSGAIWIPAGSYVQGDNTLATSDGSAVCVTSRNEIWYKYRPQTSATITVDTIGSGRDTVLSLHTGACGSLVRVACDDDSGGNLTSRFTYAATAGVTYYVRVATYGSTGLGTMQVKVTGGGGVVPAQNDDCSGRIGVALGNTVYNTVGSTTDGPAEACGNAGTFTNDVWFNYPSQCTGNLTIQNCGAVSYNSRIAVYSGAGCANLAARLISCNDDAAGCGTGSKLTIPVVAGQNYTIRVGGTSGASGTGTLNLSCVIPCPADFDGDGTLDFFDYDAFVICFEGGACPPGQTADYDADGTVDFFDYDAFVVAFEAGCN